MSLIFILLYNILSLHPFHVSTTELNIDQDQQLLKITVSVFADDLEDAVNKQLGTNTLDILNHSKYKDQVDNVGIYIYDKFYFEQDNQIVRPTFLGYGIEESMCFIFLELKLPENLEQTKIYNTILFELLRDQENLIHIFKNKQKTTHRLNNQNIWTFCK